VRTIPLARPTATSPPRAASAPSKAILLGRADPRGDIVPIERQQEIELLGEAKQHRENHQAERIEAQRQQPRQIHGEENAPAGLVRPLTRTFALGLDPGLARPHRLAQPRRVGFADIAQLGLFTLAAAGFETDHRQPQQPRQRRLLDADVGDPVVGYRARRAAEQSAFDADIVVADEVAEAPPVEPAVEQTAEQDHGDHRHRSEIAAAGAVERGDNRHEQIGQPGQRGDDQPQRAQPFAPGLLVAGFGRGQAWPCRICARIASRIASAAPSLSPGRVMLAP
jgi:hypothetical protein